MAKLIHEDGNEDDPEIILNFHKRDSSSSEDQVYKSDKLMDEDRLNVISENFIAECQEEATKQRKKKMTDEIPLDRSEKVIREAEANKTRLFPTPGNYENMVNIPGQNWNLRSLEATKASVIDENYLIIGAHVDLGIQQKIVDNEYINFARLLPKGRWTREDDNRLEIVSTGGSTYFVPISDRKNGSINSFSQWEQAFRVFSNIYTRAHPHRARELIQYNHIIHTAASTYIWENVYTYDKEFRTHLSHFPQRSWAIILQQAWAMYLKDCIPNGENHLALCTSIVKVKSTKYAADTIKENALMEHHVSTCINVKNVGSLDMVRIYVANAMQIRQRI